jgi:nucleolar protein 15
MSKFAHEAAVTRKRVRDSSASEEESIAQKIKISSVVKKAVKSATIDATESDEVTSSATPEKKARGKGKSAQLKKRAVAEKILAAETKKTKHASAISSVIYLGHIPHGFYEKEINKFFGQFGEVKRVKLFRSEKTNGSKGYAFIQFTEADVASTAASAMNGYFLGDKQLVCQLVPASKLHRGMFSRLKSKKVADELIESPEPVELTADVLAKKAKSIIKAQAVRQKKLAAMGIDFDILQSNII